MLIAPRVLVIVPVYEERSLISTKLANLDRLTYPADRLRIVIVDGGSTDGTPECAEDWASRRRNAQLLRAPAASKTAQINMAVRQRMLDEWVLVTDADAVLSPDMIERLAVATSDERTGVIGAPITPLAAHALERTHWRLSNWLRRREAGRGTAGLVGGPCYLIRGDLTAAALPDDTVADDVHFVCRAMAAGARVAIVDGDVLELRSPRTLTALFRHKLRKADAYLREIFRFLPLARQMPQPIRRVFLCRAALLIVVPALGIAGAVSALGILALAGPGPQVMAAGAAATLAIALGARRSRPYALIVALAFLLLGVSALALLLYPFSRQTATFAKVPHTPGLRFSGEFE